jgi:hypothetical protein
MAEIGKERCWTNLWIARALIHHLPFRFLLEPKSAASFKDKGYEVEPYMPVSEHEAALKDRDEIIASLEAESNANHADLAKAREDALQELREGLQKLREGLLGDEAMRAIYDRMPERLLAFTKDQELPANVAERTRFAIRAALVSSEETT